MFKYFLTREIKESYLGNLTGFSWVIIQPVLTLIIYTVVFEKIFNARIPEAEKIGFIVYLAIGFWPWTAFADSILKAIPSIVNKKDMVGKIKVDLKNVVFAAVTSVFIINMIGYLFVLLILIITGRDFNYSALPLLLLPIIQLYVFAIAMGLILSSLQIFIRDTIHVMTTFMTLWFFATPIIYSESIMPEAVKNYMKFNPVYTPITFIHNAILSNKPLPWFNMMILSVVLLVLLYLGNKMFNKLSPHFEDYM